MPTIPSPITPVTSQSEAPTGALTERNLVHLDDFSDELNLELDSDEFNLELELPDECPLTAAVTGQAMNALNTTTSTPEASQYPAPTGALTAGRLIAELWSRTESTLDRPALEWFEGASEEAEMMAANLSEVIDGIGCLVASDTQAGNFQSKDSVPTLLFSIASAIDSIRAMNLVASQASYRLLMIERGGKGGADK